MGAANTRRHRVQLHGLRRRGGPHRRVAIRLDDGRWVLPLTVAVTYLGSRAQQLSLTSPLVWIAVAILVGLVVAARSTSPR